LENILKLLEGKHGWLIVDQGFISHMGWGLAVTLLTFWLGGRRLMWIAAAWWVLYNGFFHELVEEHEDFANTWSDIVSRASPVVLFVVADALRLGQRFKWWIYSIRWLRWLVEGT
jgi:hypothetical protein